MNPALDNPVAASSNTNTGNGEQSIISGDDDEHQPDARIEFSIGELYHKAFQAMKKAEVTPRGEARQDLYTIARRLFEQALDLVESLSLFSENESVDDIANVNLKYLLIPAYLSKILISSECEVNRLQTFTKAAQYIRRFLLRIISYNLCDDPLSLQDIVDTVENTEDMSLDVRKQDTSMETAMRARTEKIEKFKRMTMLENKLEELATIVENSSTEHVDEEVVRDYYLSLIGKWVEDSVESLEREIKPAMFFERSRLSGTGQSKPKTEKYNTPSQVKITIVKDQLQKRVFGLGYPAHPTVTVDEFISSKMNSGELAFQKHQSNSLQSYAENPNLRRDQEEASDEERDLKEERDDQEELERKRRWDEFKDNNPRGSGNRHNMG